MAQQAAPEAAEEAPASQPGEVIIEQPQQKPEEEFRSQEPPGAHDPLIEEYAKRRGVSFETARSLIEPILGQDEDEFGLRAVKDYTGQLSEVMSVIPDSPQTLPVKSAMWNRAGIAASGKLTRRFEGQDDDSEFFKLAERSAMRIGMLNRVMGGGGLGENGKESPELASLRAEVSEMRKDRERDAEERRMKEAVKAAVEPLEKRLAELTPKKGDADSDIVKELKELRDEMRESRETGKEDRLLAKLGEVKTAIELNVRKEGTSLKDAETVMSTVNAIADSVGKLRGHGGGGSSQYDVVLAGVGAAENVLTTLIEKWGVEEKEAEAEEGPRRGGGAGRQEVMQRVSDNRVLRHIMENYAGGEMALNVGVLAESLGLSPQEVKASLDRLGRAGRIAFRPATPSPPQQAIEPLTQQEKESAVEVEAEPAAAPTSPEELDLSKGAPPEKTIGKNQLKPFLFYCFKCKGRKNTLAWTPIVDKKGKGFKVKCPTCGSERIARKALKASSV